MIPLRPKLHLSRLFGGLLVARRILELGNVPRLTAPLAWLQPVPNPSPPRTPFQIV